MPRRKKARKRTAKRAVKKTRTTVSKKLLDKLAHLGATHHKTLRQLKAAARTVKVKVRRRKR